MEKLVAITLQKLQEWDLNKRERALATMIVRLSFGRGRKSVWVPKLDCFVELTGIAREDVSRALRSLQESGVLQIAGKRQGGKRYTILPSAELVEPETVVDPRRMMDALIAIDEANLAEDRQLGLPNITTVEERLSADLANGSRERALSSLDIPSDPAELNRRIAESLGVEPTVGDSPTAPAKRPQPSVGKSPTLGCASPSRARTSTTSTPVPTSNDGATAPQCTGSNSTGNCGAEARRELLGRIEKIVGPTKWGPPANFAALWDTCLRHPNGVAVTAAFEALGDYELQARSRQPNDPGAYLWGMFQRIQRQLLRQIKGEVWAQ